MKETQGGIIVKIQKWGNSLGLRIPSNLAQKIDIEHGTEVEITLGNQVLLVKPVVKKPTLEELLAKITPENRHNEADWGISEGNELN
ncbi:AbrB/MazE/SpoVT family DNA-binding domain-containing protein [Fictibacillus terranigra]|uniref:AbrB/MazE/SpoVT family DNA-binding domain-containing protein n=1 Tax=Fictibacillus terranigra TaxID=3058424 RepID=A0ABT8EEH8_9BACL|nr:AbrB/MazE/SpoVT family DNA-binding domain-containing protein [Fictibacillus sp. CENA-BCM004]MDN4076295.1 AbrB/MazE/SpoVT family DNA-binding domain-containing protein [Fictibacillus sp. CENA-BCM004]